MSSTVGEFFGGSMRRIRDEVWGEIPLDKAVRTLLETAVMSRLKGMNALGFTSFAFPAAKHSRFDHSIGVYHLMRLTLKRILDSGAYLEDRDVLLGQREIRMRDREVRLVLQLGAVDRVQAP